MATEIPTAADLGDLKTAAWQAIRRFGETGLAEDCATADDAMKATEAAAEQYRMAHFPNALRCFVLADADLGQPVSIWVVFPSGPQCVYDAAVNQAAREPVSVFPHPTIAEALDCPTCVIELLDAHDPAADL